ncbi:SDR family oxidoreductase [Lentzea sp. NPDC060358]|uniref:SDR family oxidoreductase n=1 Tax=Lentzea sp. NPDC060358 TaxID=3347103 RepID=UPI003649FB80
MDTMRSQIVLVTGGNKGLGLETVRRLAALGATVVMGSRDPARGAAAAQGLANGGDVVVVPLDVTSDSSVTAAADEVERRYGRLDVLVNNAGVDRHGIPPAEVTAADMEELFATNVFGQVRVTRAFVPLLRRSPAPRIVMVSSGLGSFAVTHDPARLESTVPALAYCASKAALNMVTTQYAKALPGFRVNAADPGYTATDINGHRGPQTVSEGTDAIVALAMIAADGPTGAFVDRHGAVGW